MNAWKPLARYHVHVSGERKEFPFFTIAGALCFASQQTEPTTLFDSREKVFLHNANAEYVGHAVDVVSTDLNAPRQGSHVVLKDLDAIRARTAELRRLGYPLSHCIRLARTEWLRLFIGAHPLATRQLTEPINERLRT